MNTIVIKGRLTADPEMRKTNNGVPVANFTVAVDRTFNRDETDFFRCTAWRATAEFINQYFKKGQEILLAKCSVMFGKMRTAKNIRRGPFRLQTLNSAEARQKPIARPKRKRIRSNQTSGRVYNYIRPLFP